MLETLSPAERVAFVLHDVFNPPFDEIARILSRSPLAARKLASRARQPVQGAPTRVEADRVQQREVVGAFLAASRGGDFSALLAVLDPEVVLRSDASVVAASLAKLADTPDLTPEIHGRDEVASRFTGRAKQARLALLDGEPGLIIAFGGQPRMLFDFVIEEGRILEISLIADPQVIDGFDLEY